MFELRPQPVGIYPFPASHLILPRLSKQPALGDSALAGLMLGNSETELPEEWRFFSYAVRGELAAAKDSLLTHHANQDGDWLAYTQFLLDPSEVALQELRQRFEGQYLQMLELAAYAYGMEDTLPEPEELDGELYALALATLASDQLEKQNQTGARQRLRTAVDACRVSSPLLAAILLAQHSQLAQETPGFAPALVIQELRDAIRLAEGTHLPMFLARLWVRLGMVLQNASRGERSAQVEAINAYQVALQVGVTMEQDPELFAMLQNNLGLAYLSMPNVESSHQLRSGIAVQSFRHALRVYQKETHCDWWASVSMNLANALQYLPSSHPEENLVQAVQIYDEVLEVRSRAKDPVAYSLVLLNQANALAHLGIFKPALEKVSEAYKLFQWHDQPEEAAAARELCEQINQRLGEIGEARVQPTIASEVAS